MTLAEVAPASDEFQELAVAVAQLAKADGDTSLVEAVAMAALSGGATVRTPTLMVPVGENWESELGPALIRHITSVVPAAEVEARKAALHALLVQCEILKPGVDRGRRSCSPICSRLRC
jgi:hypothetical protein